MNDLQSKSDEELNVMLAELVGWTFHDVKTLPHTGEMVYEKFWLRPGVKIEDLNADDICWREGSSVPRYCSSLDAVATVEAGLTDEQAFKYTTILLNDETAPPRGFPTRNDWHFYWYGIKATARQRTIALIATLQKEPHE